MTAHAHHFVSSLQQQNAQRMGAWVFLASEIVLFGGLFTAYTVYRISNPAAFAQASPHLYQSIAFANTAVLLLSSLAMALAVQAARAAEPRIAAALLAATAALGLVFLTLKVFEYALDFRDAILPGFRFDPTMFDQPGAAARFFLLYVIITGLHVIHLSAGVAVVSASAVLVARRRVRLGQATAIEPVGLYWHFVDAVWVVILPLLYLVK